MYQHTRHREVDPAPSVFALRKDLLDDFLTDLNTGRRLCLLTRPPQLPFTPPASRRRRRRRGAVHPCNSLQVFRDPGEALDVIWHVLPPGCHDDDVYYYIGERLKLGGEDGTVSTRLETFG